MASNTLRIARTGSLLWLWWFLTGLAGFIGGMAIKTAIDLLAEAGGFSTLLATIPAPVFGALLGAMLGSSTGLAQWLVLRRRLAGVGMWLPATLAAWVLFWFLHNAAAFGFAHTPDGLVLQGFTHGAIVGTMIGIAQYLVLRGQVEGARRWVLISAASWSAAGGLMHYLLDVAFASANIHGPFDILIASSLAALFTGVGLQQLLAETP